MENNISIFHRNLESEHQEFDVGFFGVCPQEIVQCTATIPLWHANFPVKSAIPTVTLRSSRLSSRRRRKRRPASLQRRPPTPRCSTYFSTKLSATIILQRLSAKQVSSNLQEINTEKTCQKLFFGLSQFSDTPLTKTQIKKYT